MLCSGTGLDQSTSRSTGQSVPFVPLSSPWDWPVNGGPPDGKGLMPSARNPLMGEALAFGKIIIAVRRPAPTLFSQQEEMAHTRLKH